MFVELKEYSKSMETEQLKQIALANKHVELGAKMVPFAGFSMPVQYAGVIEEHKCVRKGVGIFDVSHMGEFYVRGEKALDLIQYITSNDASKLVSGKAQYSCFPNGKGGIVDDLIVYMISDEEYLLVVNGANIEKDWNWVVKQNEGFGADLEDKSDTLSLFAVQGPKAVEALQKLTSLDLSEIGFYTFEIGEFAGHSNVIVSATGYTGSGGFEIYVSNDIAEDVFNKILDAGQDLEIMPIGLAARDTLRLEMGYCLYGNDITDETSPLEAGLGWITKLKKDSDFVDKAWLTEQKAEGIKRKLVAFEMLERGIPRKDYPLCDAEGNEIGFVTSGTQSPMMEKGIGMGYVTKELATVDQEIFVQVRKKQLKAKLVKLPFYKSK